METLGLLVMAYGAPATPDDLEDYYTHIRHGNRPPAWRLSALDARYRAIGGQSPLATITQAQATGLTQRMNARFQNRRFKAYVGFKHCRPYIEDAVAAIHATGIKVALSAVMAPHDGSGEAQDYHRRAARAARHTGALTLHRPAGWHRTPAFIAFWARRIHAALDALAPDVRARALVLFSAHSLPLTADGVGEYARQVLETAAAIAQTAGIQHHAFAWQSAGQTSQTWLGPNLLDTIRQHQESDPHRTFLICPIGFVTDNLEVLYDDDIECRALVEQSGGHYLRPALPNADEDFLAVLADALEAALARKVDEA